MNDIEKLIEYIKDHSNNYLGSKATLKEIETFEYMYDLLIGTLEKQLNGGWISVKEKLPEVCGLGILLTIENKFQQRKVIQGFTGYMERGKLEFHTNEKDTNLEVWKVIAWMPLPKAYKEEENE